MEYGISFDHGQWIVVAKGGTGIVGWHASLESCLMQIQQFTGAPVVIKVLTAADGEAK